MKKRTVTVLFFAFIMATAVFAENYRYYAFQKSGSSNILFVIMQTKEKLTDEQLKNLEASGGGALNTKQERLAAELGLDKNKYDILKGTKLYQNASENISAVPINLYVTRY